MKKAIEQFRSMTSNTPMAERMRYIEDLGKAIDRMVVETNEMVASVQRTLERETENKKGNK